MRVVFFAGLIGVALAGVGEGECTAGHGEACVDQAGEESENMHVSLFQGHRARIAQHKLAEKAQSEVPLEHGRQAIINELAPKGSEIEKAKLEHRQQEIIQELAALEVVMASEHAALLAAETAEGDTVANYAACNKPDADKLAAAGAGNGDATFPGMNAKCGKDAYSFWWGFNKQRHANCLHDALGIRQECGMCFAHQGQYTADNCKWACMSSWCHASCLSCSNAVIAQTQQCVGSSVVLPSSPGC